MRAQWERVSLYSPQDVARFLLEVHSSSPLDQGLLTAYEKEYLRHANGVSVTKVCNRFCVCVCRGGGVSRGQSPCGLVSVGWVDASHSCLRCVTVLVPQLAAEHAAVASTLKELRKVRITELDGTIVRFPVMGRIC